MSKRRKRLKNNIVTQIPNLGNNVRAVSIEELRHVESLQRRLHELERLADEAEETWNNQYEYIRTELQIDSIGDEIGSIIQQLKGILRSIRYGNNKHKHKQNKIITNISGNSNKNQQNNYKNQNNHQQKNKDKKKFKPRFCEISLDLIEVCYGFSGRLINDKHVS